MRLNQVLGKKWKNMNSKDTTIYESVEKKIYSKNIDRLSYAELQELRRELFDAWVVVRDTLFHEKRWEHALAKLSHLMTLRKEKSFEQGEVQWEMMGGLRGTQEFINVIAPTRNGNKVSCYSATVKKQLVYGFAEVSNGVYGYWVHRPK